MLTVDGARNSEKNKKGFLLESLALIACGRSFWGNYMGQSAGQGTARADWLF